MHASACVRAVECRLQTQPLALQAFPLAGDETSGRRGRVMSEAKGGEPGAHRGKSMHARVQEFVSSCHVPSFSATPTGGGQTCVRGGKHVLARTRHAGTQPQACLPAACTRPFGPSVHPSIHSSFPNSESAGQAQSSDQTHHSWLSSLGHSIHPRFQRAQTPIPECMYVDVSCLMFVSSLCLFLPSLGPKNRPLLSIFTHEPSSWHTAILDLSTF
jgi:hypothetical protein